MTISTDIASQPQRSPAPDGPAPVGLSSPRHAVHRWFDRIVVVTFILAIIVPLIGTLFHWDRAAPLMENRALATWPRAPHSFRETTRLSDNLLNYFSDHFGFRNTLIHAANTWMYRAVGPAHTRTVIIGRDGWLFMHPVIGDLAFNAENGFLPFSDAQLDQWQALLEKRYAFVSGRGIPLVLVIAPDKDSIYPEHFPVDSARRKMTRLDQLIARLQVTRSPVHIVDLRAALLAGKSAGDLYLHLDTHWNDNGAWIGYQQIITAVGQALPAFAIIPQTRENFTVQDEGQQSGDLAGLLALDDALTEPRFWLQHRPPFAFQELRVNGADTHTVDFPDAEAPAVRRPRLLMFRDSFATALFQMIPPHFSHCLWVWNNDMDGAIIDREKPDVVVDEFVERNLYGPVPTDSADIRAMPWPMPAEK